MYNFRENFTIDENQLVNLKIESWITPKDASKKNYKRIVNQLQKDIKQLTYELSSILKYQNNYIINLDIRYSGIKYGKHSYMSCEIILAPKGEKLETQSIEEYLTYLQILFAENIYFNFQKNKS